MLLSRATVFYTANKSFTLNQLLRFESGVLIFLTKIILQKKPCDVLQEVKPTAFNSLEQHFYELLNIHLSLAKIIVMLTKSWKNNRFVQQD